MARSGVLDCLRKLIQQDQLDEIELELVLKAIRSFLTSGALMSRKEATNNKFLITLKKKDVVKKIKKLKENQKPGIFEPAIEI